MDDLNVLKKYIGEKIKSIEENNKLIEQKQEQVAKLEKIYSPLISGKVVDVVSDGEYTINDVIMKIEDENVLTLFLKVKMLI